MSIDIEAIYGNGVFRPLGPVALAEGERVRVKVEPVGAPDLADPIHFALSPERWRALCEALDAPPKVIPALRNLLTEPSVFDGNSAPVPAGPAPAGA